MRNTALWVLALLVAGCGSSTSNTDDLSGVSQETTSSSGATASTGSSPTTAAPSTSVETTAAAPSATTFAAEENLIVFISTLEELLEGTSYEGEALNEPDVFVATGRFFCERLNYGDSADDVLTAYLDQLVGGVDVATDDELVLAGALLGAAVGALCPEHVALVG